MNICKALLPAAMLALLSATSFANPATASPSTAYLPTPTHVQSFDLAARGDRHRGDRRGHHRDRDFNRGHHRHRGHHNDGGAFLGAITAGIITSAIINNSREGRRYHNRECRVWVHGNYRYGKVRNNGLCYVWLRGNVFGYSRYQLMR